MSTVHEKDGVCKVIGKTSSGRVVTLTAPAHKPLAEWAAAVLADARRVAPKR